MSPDETPPTLRDLLAEAAGICRGVGVVVLADAQGLVVAQFEPKADLDAEELAAEALAGLRALGPAATAAGVGSPQECVVVGEGGTLVVRRLVPWELLLALAVPGEEWIGRARFAARVVAGRLAQALSR